MIPEGSIRATVLLRGEALSSLKSKLSSYESFDLIVGLKKGLLRPA